jgi:RNA polymerase primary sigma factor
MPSVTHKHGAASPAARDVEQPAADAPASTAFVWDDDETDALREARRDAELTASVDSVRAYLKQIGRVALLNAEREVELAKRIEAGLYAAERLSEATDGGGGSQVRRDLRWIVRDGQRAKDNLVQALTRFRGLPKCIQPRLGRYQGAVSLMPGRCEREASQSVALPHG